VIVHRNIFINPVEPDYVAFRISQGVTTKVVFHIKTPGGAPLPADTVAQLQVTSRSRNITEYYACPAIDVVNGVAQAVIPKDLGYDPNGYNLRLTGTVNREPRVLAYGVMTTLAGAGPQVEAQDVIDSIDLSLFYGQPTTITVTLWQDAGKSAPYDLTGMEVSANVLASQLGGILQPFSVVGISGSAVTISLTAAQVDTLPALCWWTLAVTSGVGTTTLAQGNVYVRTVPT
jgi:hypothetical protein